MTKPLGNALSSLVTGAISGFAGAAGGGASAGLTHTTGSLSSALNTAIPSTFAGLQARAGGGPVMAGHPYLVGERGPEVLIPRMNGMIAPNHALGGTTVNQTNHITVSGGTTTEIAKLRQEIQIASAQAARAGAEGGRALVISDLQRDGPTSRAIRR